MEIDTNTSFIGDKNEPVDGFKASDFKASDFGAFQPSRMSDTTSRTESSSHTNATSRLHNAPSNFNDTHSRLSDDTRQDYTKEARRDHTKEDDTRSHASDTYETNSYDSRYDDDTASETAVVVISQPRTQYAYLFGVIILILSFGYMYWEQVATKVYPSQDLNMTVAYALAIK